MSWLLRWRLPVGNDVLLEHFAQMVSRAEDVPKLNEAILQLAVQGKLVSQDPNDEPASELIKRIEAEKQQLIEEKKIKKSKPLPEITDEERPFTLPEGWEWARLGNLVSQMGSGSTPRGGKKIYQEKGIKFLRSQNVWNEGLRIDGVACIPPEIHEKMKRTTVYPKDILLNITGASIGRSALVSDDFDTGNVSQHVCIIRLIGLETRQFIHKCIISPYFQKTIMDVQVGISREGLSKASLSEILVPLPPLAEQKRILKHVDILLAQTRQLEKELADAEKSLSSLHRAATRDLLSASDAVEFEQKWQFIANNFDTLYDEAYPEAALANVAELKQTILQLAVQGKLTRQDKMPNCVKLGEIVSLRGGGTPSKRNPEYWGGEIPWISPKDMKKLDLYDSKDRITEFAVQSKAAKLIPINSVLVVVRGMILLHTVPAGVLRVNAAINQDIKALIPSSSLTSEYLRLIIWGHNPNLLNLIERSTHGTCKLKTPDLLNFEVLLPALAEQKRIVTRVNTLLHLCDALSTHIQEAQATRTALRDAVLAGVG